MGPGVQSSMRDVCLFMMHIRNITQSLLYCIVTILVTFVSLSDVIAAKDPNKGDQGLAGQPSVKQSEAPNPSDGPKASPADLAASILARPLFEPGRRPPARAQAQKPALVMPRLAGIVIAPGYSVAIFQQASSPRPIALKAGEVLEKVWTVEGITAGQVTLARDNTVLVLTPHGVANQDPPNPEPTRSWKVGLRRSDPVPSYLRRLR